VTDAVTYQAPDDATEIERRRHGYLAEICDPHTRHVLERIGAAEGWRCLDVGAGGGSVARWLAERVGASGHVLATDVDLRFLEQAGASNLEVRQHDIVNDELDPRAFDLVHARGVLEHIPARAQALARMIAATRPGGFVVIEDTDWTGFDEQPLPEAFKAFFTAVHGAYVHTGYDPAYGRAILGHLVDAGLGDVGAEARCWTMHGGQPSAEWYTLGLERAVPLLVQAGIVTDEIADAGLQALRNPSFIALSPITVSAWGRAPGIDV
jgi:SAM-dependent methyltransferase